MDRGNNALENLAWCTSEENVLHSYNNNNRRKSNIAKRSKPVRGRIVGTEVWTEYQSVSDAARSVHVNSRVVTAACRDKRFVPWNNLKYEFELSNPVEEPSLVGEEWRLCGENNERISNIGRYKDCHGIVKTPLPKKDGYCYVKRKNKTCMVHVLVAKAFLSLPRKEQTQVNHIDGRKDNNRINNLEWVTASQNIVAAYRNNPNRKLGVFKRNKQIQYVSPCGNLQLFTSSRSASRALGVKSNIIMKACKAAMEKQFI